jgi:hypothetical protein
VAFLVARRTCELAIRIALGASARRLQGQVVDLLLAAGVGALLRSLLVGVSIIDPPSASAAALLVLAAGRGQLGRGAPAAKPLVVSTGTAITPA